MADPSPRTPPDRDSGGCLKNAVDAGLFSGAHTPSEDPGGDSASSDAAGESPRWTGVATSFRLFSESMLRMELAEVEMAKAREALRLEAERRRAELEGEMTRMLLQTQLQIATVVAGKSQSGGRKRKRAEDEDRASASTREGALLLSLLHCNLLF
ncbi:uncharacterized protein At4g22160 [Rhodamnia argentea]|uniref:Uncharacterized protein At4g22160 n=1 Tax=Rhodamnia argentea TaxID=178133 RepID=A0A8B8R3D8_9MYRT|nr:uncharacterized protein At4g22160 [Rhodamnia argentea]